MRGKWVEGKNCEECYFYMPGEGCALAEGVYPCKQHYVDWDLLLEVYPWDSRLIKHFPKEVIDKRIKELEGK
jgi:hypothetical protein